MNLQASIIIPTYNRRDRLRLLLDRVVLQLSPTLREVIICDDGSSDGTRKLVESYSDRLPIFYCWQPDLGFRAARARNLGIARAKADVLIFLDDDCIIQDRFIESHVTIHQADGISVGIGARRRINSAALSGDYADAEEDNRTALDANSFARHPHPWMLVYSCNLSSPRKAPEIYFDERFEGWGGEDIDLGFRLWRAGGRMIPVSDAKVLHVEDEVPRDPFRCEVIGQKPNYGPYLHNVLRILDKYPNDAELEVLRTELRWYLKHEGVWVKARRPRDPDIVIRQLRLERAFSTS